MSQASQADLLNQRRIQAMLERGDFNGVYAELQKVYTACVQRGVEADNGYVNLHLLALAKEKQAQE